MSPIDKFNRYLVSINPDFDPNKTPYDLTVFESLCRNVYNSDIKQPQFHIKFAPALQQEQTQILDPNQF